MLVERDGRRGVVHIPAEAAIVEVDDLHCLTVDQKVGEPQVAMNEAETVMALAEGDEPAADQVSCTAKEFRFGGVDTHAVTPASPMGSLFAEARLEIPVE